MITKERLEELIEQEATVWFVSGTDAVPFCLFHHYKYVDYEETNLYENKEDAEFVAKYYTQRVEKFEPPTWEEIEKDFIGVLALFLAISKSKSLDNCLFDSFFWNKKCYTYL